MIDSPRCTFCKSAIELLEHPFYKGEITRSFWVALRSWLMECNISLEPLSVVKVLFGIFNAGEDFVIVNHLILVATFYICRCKLNGVKPAMRVIKKKSEQYIIQKVEQHLCRIRQNSMTKNGKKLNVVLIESIPPPPPPRSVIVICIFLLSSIHIDLFFQDKVQCSSFKYSCNASIRLYSLCNAVKLLIKSFLQKKNKQTNKQTTPTYSNYSKLQQRHLNTASTVTTPNYSNYRKYT